jgi:hypothetical protein
MKKILITLSLAGALLALPTTTDAWVACGHAGWGGYHGVAVGGACWHGGYHCGGVSTGTAVAAGFAGLAVGAAVGSAVAHANTPAYVVAPAPVVYTTPYYYAPPPIVVPPTAPVGSIYYSLPPGAQSANINGTQYYVLGSTYYRPYFGNNGVYYEVVTNPI